MLFYLAWILVIISFFPYTSQNIFTEDPEVEWRRMEANASPGVLPKHFRNAPGPDYMWLPDFVKVTEAVDQKPLFEPALGSRPLQNSLEPILLPSTNVAPVESAETPLVEMLCHIERIYVRIRRHIFKTLRPWRFLKLGNCVVNQGSSEHFYFLYHTTDCDFIIETSPDHLIIRNFLRFLPTTVILRDMPFNIDLQCNYHRYIHAYKVGIWPMIQGATMYKSLRTRLRFVIIPQDAFGYQMTAPYNMGDTMYFEVRRADGGAFFPDDRVYIHECFITPSIVPTSFEEKIIARAGCMLYGMEAEDSKFLIGPSMTTQRFSLNAGILLEMATMTPSTVQLFMHCIVLIADHTPTESNKACNYNLATSTWTELYGDDSVCACCATACPSSPGWKASRNEITSQPWQVSFDFEKDDKSRKKIF